MATTIRSSPVAPTLNDPGFFDTFGSSVIDVMSVQTPLAADHDCFSLPVFV
jgi:hypothetical protein